MTKPNQKQIPAHLLSEIKNALESVKFGSIEIFVQNRIITQITVRNIHKTSMDIEKNQENINNSANVIKSNL